MKKIILVSILIFGVALYADNFRRSGQVKFKLESVSLSKHGPEKADRTFMPGQTVWVNLKVSGLKKNDNKDIVFQSDLLMVGKGGRVVLDKKNILDQKLHAGDIKPVVNATYNIDLYQSIRAERYKVKVVFRDMVAKKLNIYNTWFKVVK